MDTDEATSDGVRLDRMLLHDDRGRGGRPRSMMADLGLLRRAIHEGWFPITPKFTADLIEKIETVWSHSEDPRVVLQAAALGVAAVRANAESAKTIMKTLEVEEAINQGHEDDETPKRPTVFTVDTIEDGQKVLSAMREGPVEVEYDDGPAAEVAAALDAIRDEVAPSGPVPVVESPPTPAPAPLAEAGHVGNGNGKPKRRLTY